MDKAQKKTRLQLEALESFYAGTLLRCPNLSLCARARFILSKVFFNISVLLNWVQNCVTKFYRFNCN